MMFNRCCIKLNHNILNYLELYKITLKISQDLTFTCILIFCLRIRNKKARNETYADISVLLPTWQGLFGSLFTGELEDKIH